MRILGVDFGDVRTGYAVSDPTGFLAGGIGTEKASGLREAVEITCRKAQENGAEKIVVGLPLNLNGSEGDRAERVRTFARMVEEKSGLPVEFCDERRTPSWRRAICARRELSEKNERHRSTRSRRRSFCKRIWTSKKA